LQAFDKGFEYDAELAHRPAVRQARLHKFVAAALSTCETFHRTSLILFGVSRVNHGVTRCIAHSHVIMSHSS
jgi:hypothetical protein